MNTTPNTPTTAVDTDEKQEQGGEDRDTRAATEAVTPAPAVATTPDDTEGAPADAVAPETTDAQDTETQHTEVENTDDAEDTDSDDTDDTDDLLEVEDLADEDGASRTSTGAGAAAVVAAALGVVSLTGTWTSRVGAERETLVGQLHMSQGAPAAQQISELYGDGWHVTALVNGAVGLVAVLLAVGVVVLLGRTGGWAKPVAVAGLVLGAIGVLVGLGMYFDLFAALPTAPAAVATTPTS